MKNYDVSHHVCGRSQYIDDLPEPAETLHGAIYTSPIAAGRFQQHLLGAIPIRRNLVSILTAEDIPGTNQIGGIISDEPLLAAEIVSYLGQPVALVLAESARQARDGRDRIQIDFQPEPAIFDEREAFRQGELIAPPRRVELGDVDRQWLACDVVVEGQTTTGAQEHLYLETQAALAVPEERNRIKLYSATQAPSSVQRIVAQVLHLPMHRITVETARLGGAFGGKEDQATPIAALAALGCHCTQRPVKIVLQRNEDMRITGKRHPYSCDYKIGLNRDGKILAYEAHYYQNCGATADLSTAIMERSLFHGTGAYQIPNVRLCGYSCRTNLPPFTAFRGFGAPQAMFCIEAAIDHAAQVLAMDRSELQRQNLVQNGDILPYGMKISDSRAVQTFDAVCQKSDYHNLGRATERFNRDNPLRKRGLAAMPICFGISFTNSFLNQAGSLVHLYQDGSVRISTGAVEMGQGVNTKLLAVAEKTLGVLPEKLTIENTNTGHVANTSPTAASSGADLNGKAVEAACNKIARRLIDLAAQKLSTQIEKLSLANGYVFQDGQQTSISLDELIQLAYRERIFLSATAHYATPNLFYDREREKGTPFAYHVYGTAIIEVELDCLRGIADVTRVWVTHDGGKSLHREIDLGQMEGGLLQGIGWLMMEEIRYERGELVTDTLSTYKTPDIYSTFDCDIDFLRLPNPDAVGGSKAIGEPPFLYGIAAYFATVAAIRAFRPDFAPPYRTPLTPEQTFIGLHRIYARGEKE